MPDAVPDDCRAGEFLRRAQDTDGFSLVELIVVLIVAGVLAVVAMGRFADRKTFDTQGFYDEVIATVRYAQKDAISKRRNVCLAFSANSVTLTYASAAGSGAACDSNETSPGGVSPYAVTANSGVSFVPAPTNFAFDALGRPSLGQTVNVVGDGTRSFTIEPETGYVHP
ncbi:MAG TPA: type II secretion system protein [Burkholderiales bacterium]|nr:type II secretion system protein [Burkholderiales bacterium]